MKFAYFVKPHIGGTFTVFEQIRLGLAPAGIELRWIGMEHDGPPGGAIPEQDLLTGELIPSSAGASDRDLAAEVLRRLEAGAFDGTFVNVLADQIQMNLARYLPQRFLRIMIVHSISPATYAAAAALRGNMHATVGVSERCRRDLVSRHGFPRDRTIAIRNAVDVRRLVEFPRSPRPDSQLRLLFLGRIEDAPKGVLWLPRIMGRLPATVTLTVAGDGPDLAALKLRAGNDGRFRFLGAVPSSEVPALLADHDVLIMPSRFEGFGMSVVEAMASGCVPVASRIGGVTDSHLDHGADGLLFRVGDLAEAARHVRLLHDDRELLAAMSRRARERASADFGVEAMGEAYARLIGGIAAQSPAIDDPLDLDDWAMPAGFRPGLRRLVPAPVKNWLRVARERL